MDIPRYEQTQVNAFLSVSANPLGVNYSRQTEKLSRNIISKGGQEEISKSFP